MVLGTLRVSVKHPSSRLAPQFPAETTACLIAVELRCLCWAGPWVVSRRMEGLLLKDGLVSLATTLGRVLCWAFRAPGHPQRWDVCSGGGDQQ